MMRKWKGIFFTDFKSKKTYFLKTLHENETFNFNCFNLFNKNQYTLTNLLYVYFRSNVVSNESKNKITD